MGIFKDLADLGTKAITEHGSSDVQKQRADFLAEQFKMRVEFAQEQYEALERKVGEQQIEIGKLRAQLDSERLNLASTEAELLKIRKEHEEEIRIYKRIEFRRGKRTSNKWLPFCPSCHLPLNMFPGDKNYPAAVYMCGVCKQWSEKHVAVAAVGQVVDDAVNALG